MHWLSAQVDASTSIMDQLAASSLYDEEDEELYPVFDNSNKNTSSKPSAGPAGAPIPVVKAAARDCIDLSAPSPSRQVQRYVICYCTL